MTKANNSFVYRPWIDGWRAIAVILVILNHYFGLLPVGYIGVDIFFVISGFLVGGILYQQVITGRFSLGGFYIKRIHRIVPAQLFMMAAVFISLVALSLPEEIIERYTQEVTYSVISISNYFYWHSIGYFDIESTRKFLLHTWSLAVEEQFYLVFPLLLLLATRLTKNKGLGLILLLFILSFAGNLLPWADLPSKFYLLPFRFWEFLLGFGVYYMAEKKLFLFREQTIAAIVSLLLLVILQFNPYNFSELTLILSSSLCFGILFAALENGGLTTLSKLLSSPLFRYIGTISYSLYLSHWPVMVLMRLKFGIKEISALNFIVYLTATLLIGLVSYYLVEKTFRISNEKYNRTARAVSAVFILLLMVGTAAFITSKKPYSVIHLLPFKTQKYTLPGCGELIVESSVVNDSVPTIVIWGDSHAGMLAFRETRYSTSYNIFKIYSTGCPPFFNTAVTTECNCNDKNKILTAWKIIRQLKPSYVVLASRFSIYINGLTINNVLRRGNHYISSDSTIGDVSLAGRKKAFRLGLQSTLDSLSGLQAKVIIMKQVPDFANFHNPESLVSGGVYSVLPHVLFRPLADADSIIHSFETDKVKVFDPRGFFKGDRGYLIFDQERNRLLYRDDSHLSPTGAMRVTTPLLKEITQWK